MVKYYKPYYNKQMVKAVDSVLRSGHTTSGKKVKELEEMFCKISGYKYALAVSSATDGLFLALKVAMKPSSGGKKYIVTTPFTFVATIEAIKHNGFEPYYCDISLEDFNMDLSLLDRSGDLKSRDIVGYLPVNYGGNRCLLKVDDDKPIVVDAAHSSPGGICGVKGDIFVFSFYANKIFQCGEGGIIVTDNENYYNKMKTLSIHGRTVRQETRFDVFPYEVDTVGYKMNLSDINAAIVVEQLKKIDHLTKLRQKVALYYMDKLKNIKGVSFNPFHPYNSYHLFPILTKRNLRIITEFRMRGIGYSMHYKPVPLMKAYAKPGIIVEENIDNAVEAFNQTVSLPIYPGLKKNEMNQVIEAIRHVMEDM